MSASTAAPPQVSFAYQIDVTAQMTDVMQIMLNGSTQVLVPVDLPMHNAGMDIGDVTVTTYSGDPWPEPVKLQGADANRFTLSNNGVAPCKLRVGGNDLTTQIYDIKLAP